MKKKFYQRDGFKSRAVIFLILALASVVIVIPYVWMLSNSFKTTKETLVDPSHLIPQEFTLIGYKQVLTESPFLKWLRNSVIVTGANVIITLFTSSLLGYIFSKFQFKGKKILFTLLMLTMMVPKQVTMITSFLLIDGIGLYGPGLNGWAQASEVLERVLQELQDAPLKTPA